MKNRYRYYNRNPDGLHLEDCVCRAISTVTDIDYDIVNKLLELTARAYGCDKLCVCCYHNLLEDIFGYGRYTCMDGETVEDIAAKHPKEYLLIRIDSHLTCSIKGIIPDIWDCSGKLVDCFWVVK